MKNNIKTLFAALVMTCAGMATAYADTNHPERFVKVTRSQISYNECYIDFEYPDYDFDGNDDAMIHVDLGVELWSGNRINLSKMYRCHDEMKRYNHDYGAMEILGTDVRKELRTTRVRFYPTEKAMRDVKGIYVKGTWDIDDDGGKVIPVDEFRSVDLKGGAYNNGHHGSIEYDGNEYFVNKFGADGLPSGWNHHMYVKDGRDFFNSTTYYDGDLSSSRRSLRLHEFVNNKEFVGYSSIERSISVRNGSFHAGEGDVRITQRMHSDPYVFNKISCDKITDGGFNYRETEGYPQFSFYLAQHEGTEIDAYRTAEGSGRERIATFSCGGSTNFTWVDKTADVTVTYDYDFVSRKIDWGYHRFNKNLSYSIKVSGMDISFEGSGTSSSPYLIKNDEDFRKLAYAFNNGQKSFKKKYWKLTNDIGWKQGSYDRIPGVGTENNPFDGYFDGCGHTMNISVFLEWAGNHSPFCYVKDATIKNLRTTGEVYTNDKYTGGLAVMLSGTTVENCEIGHTIETGIEGNAYHGGFAGKAEAYGGKPTRITNCVFSGVIKPRDVSANSCAGFVASMQNGGSKTDCVITSCMNTGKITVDDYGCDVFVRNPGAEINNCYYKNFKNNNRYNARKLDESCKGVGLLDKLNTGWYIYAPGVYPVLKTFAPVGSKDVVLDNTCELNTTSDVRVPELEFVREFHAGERCTVTLPFALTSSEASEWGRFYTLDHYTAATGDVFFKLVEGGIEADKPYVFEAGSDFSNVEFSGKTIRATSGMPDASHAPSASGLVGTTRPVTVPEGAYGYSAGYDSFQRGEFVKVGSNVHLPSFCAYMWLTDDTAPATLNAVFTDDGGNVTGIETLTQDEENPTIYSLDGRKLDKPEHGINIINGKKVLVK